MSDELWVLTGCGIYTVIAFLVGQIFQAPKGSVHRERMGQMELLSLGMGWPIIVAVLFVAWVEYRKSV